MLDEKLALLGALIVLLADGKYLVNTLKGKTRPNKVSWLIWGIAPALAFSAEFKQNVGWPSLMTLSIAIVPFLIFLGSFLNKKSQWKITKFDIFCGSLSVIGLFLWQITQVGNIAIFFGILSDGFAFVPTYFKSWKHPESESYSAYLGSAISGLITLLIIKNWNFASYGFPLYIFLSCSFAFALIKFRLGIKIQKHFASSHKLV